MRYRFVFFAALSSAALIAPCTAKTPPPVSTEASIPFANRGGIYDWKALDDSTLYIQARNRKWYRAQLVPRCNGLTFAIKIGFDTGLYPSFDRSSYVLVDGQRCPLQSLVESGPPPKKAK